MKNFRKPLIVAGIVFAFIAAAITLSLTKMGVLQDYRDYSATVEAAKEKCFPTTAQELSDKFPIKKQDGVTIAREIVAKLAKEANTKIYTPTPATPFAATNPYPPEVIAGCKVLEPLLNRLPELEKAKQWFGLPPGLSSINSSDVLKPKQSVWLGAIAGHLANHRDIKNASRVWRLRSLLLKAHGERTWATAHLVELSEQKKHLTEIAGFAPFHSTDPEFQACAKFAFDTALRPYDYRKVAWSDMLLLNQALITGEDLGGSLSTPFGRSMLIVSKQPFRTATATANLRGYLASYAMLEANPNSVQTCDDYFLTVRKNHAASNSVSADFLRELGPIFGFAAKMSALERDIKLLKAKITSPESPAAPKATTNRN